MYRRDFLTGLAGAAGVLATRSFAGAAGTLSPRFMYVGSFTSPERGHGNGITVFQRAGAAPWKQIQLVKDLENPSFLITDRQRRFLYAVHSDGDRASAYRIDSATGRLSLLNHQATGGQNGVHLSIDPTGRLLVVANYASGTLALLPIDQDGSLGALKDLAPLKGTPGPHRIEQPGPHPHHCPFDPSGKFIVVPDKGVDKIFVFRLDTAAGKLVPADPPSVAAKAGAGPRHVGFHPTRPFAYVINELDSTMTTYHLDPATGALKPLQRISTLPGTFTGDSTAAEIAVARSGRFVYGSNRGHDSIVTFAVNSTSGVLTPIGWEPTQGGTPRYFGFDPAENYLYAANQTGDSVVAFRPNKITGKLTPTGDVMKLGAPCTIAFCP